ncbi:hypothetical protein LX36DRAFT_111768 [Colletotrichum falcatum]|nr:hypothetical protein LX36DRAFT_111768 [Colletotrichum falcatum]
MGQPSGKFPSSSCSALLLRSGRCKSAPACSYSALEGSERLGHWNLGRSLIVPWPPNATVRLSSAARAPPQRRRPSSTIRALLAFQAKPGNAQSVGPTNTRKRRPSLEEIGETF